MNIERFSGPVYEFSIHERTALTTPEHSHERGQLLFICEGLATLKVLQSVYTLVQGRCVWIPPRTAHSMQTLGAVDGHAVYLPQETCANFPPRSKTLSVTPLLKQVVARLTSSDGTSSAPDVQRRLLLVLCDELHQPQPDFLHLPVPQDRRLQQLVGLQTSAPELNRDLSSWARKVGMSKRSISRHFHKEVGMTFGQWRQRMRILRASGMLLTGSSVTDAAVAVGYDSVSAFTKTFRLIFGQPPAQFRELHTSLSQP
jgi:AraC-like DNA-binding protein